MELRHLNLIVAVARCGSLSKAAGGLHLTQSALSHQLREIESDLGLPVFHRVRQRRMVPTIAGERLLTAAKVIRSTLDAALADIKQMSDGDVGSLRICTGCYTGYSWLSPLAAQFARKHPKIDLTIAADATPRPIGALLDASLDLALSPVDGDFNGQLEYLPLFHDELVAVLPASHRLADQNSVTAEDLRDEHLFTYDLDEDDLSVFRDFLRPAAVRPKKVTRVQLSEAILAMVRAELGVTVMARWAVVHDLRSSSLVIRPLGPKGVIRQWYAITPKGISNRKFVTDFVELVRAKATPARLESVDPKRQRGGRGGRLTGHA